MNAALGGFPNRKIGRAERVHRFADRGLGIHFWPSKTNDHDTLISNFPVAHTTHHAIDGNMPGESIDKNFAHSELLYEIFVPHYHSPLHSEAREQDRTSSEYLETQKCHTRIIRLRAASCSTLVQRGTNCTLHAELHRNFAARFGEAAATVQQPPPVSVVADNSCWPYDPNQNGEHHQHNQHVDRFTHLGGL